MRKYTKEEWRLDGLREPGDKDLSVRRLCIGDLMSQDVFTDREAQVELARQYADGMEEKGVELTFTTVRWVVKLAYIFARKYDAHHLLLDLIQEGMMGVMKAVEKYDPDLGYAYSTYTSWWIRQHMSRFLISELESVRLPNYKMDQLNKLKRMQHYLMVRLERRATTEELARELGIGVEKVEKLRELHTHNRVASLEAPLGDDDGDGDRTLLDILFREDGRKIVLEAVIQDELARRFMGFIRRTFGSRQVYVIESRLGLNGTGRMTLEEIGEAFGEMFGYKVTRERIRQIEKKVLSDGRVRWFAAKLLSMKNGHLPEPRKNAGKNRKRTRRKGSRRKKSSPAQARVTASGRALTTSVE